MNGKRRTLGSKRVAMLVAMLVGASCLFVGWRAKAGYKISTFVTINTNPSSGDPYALGAMGSARNSGDGNQYIGCLVDGYDNNTYSGACYALNAAGTQSANCYTTNPTVLNAIRSISGGTRIYFKWQASTGICTLVEAANISYWAPEVP
jgi:hypothetical protein